MRMWVKQKYYEITWDKKKKQQHKSVSLGKPISIVTYWPESPPISKIGPQMRLNKREKKITESVIQDKIQLPKSQKAWSSKQAHS